MTEMRKAIHMLTFLFVLIVAAGCSSSTEEQKGNTDWGKAHFFTEGQWFYQKDVKIIQSGVVEGDYGWNFDWYGFETMKNEEGKPAFRATLADIGGQLEPCEYGWCLEGKPMIRFETVKGDTLAFFARDPQDSDAAFKRMVPPDLTVNSYPDWMYRKYYFAGTYSCKYPRQDSTFELSLDENGKVNGSERYVRYEFHNQHNRPLFVLYDTEGQAHSYAFATYAELKNGFSLHEVLNQEELMDGEGGTVEIGGFMYEFEVK